MRYLTKVERLNLVSKIEDFFELNNKSCNISEQRQIISLIKCSHVVFTVCSLISDGCDDEDLIRAMESDVSDFDLKDYRLFWSKRNFSEFVAMCGIISDDSK